jgi:hypothetical protein
VAINNQSDEMRLLSEIARWTRQIALPTLRPRVERLLDTDQKKRVYEAIAAGTASVVAVEKATGANHNDIKVWLKIWESEGIVEPNTNPPKATFTLSELGIAPAPPRAARAAKSK